MPLRLITPSDLDALSHAAQAAPRRRLNLNLHADFTDPCQRLFNAVDTDSYIRPHRHTDPPRLEFFLVVRGRFLLLLFDDSGRVTERCVLGPGEDILAAEVPAGIWHALVALEPGSVFFEVKPGPYVPLSDKDFAPWAPVEGSVEATEYLRECLNSPK